MEIKGTMIYTNEIVKKIAKFSMFKNKALPAIIIVCEIIFLFSIVLLSLANQWQEDPGFMGLLVFFVVFFPAVIWLTPVFAVRASKKLLGLENYFTFTEDGITLAQKSPTVNGQMELKYGTLDKIYETKDCFYIFLSKAQGYPLLKKDIEDGKSAELARILREKLADKFVQKN